MPKVQQGITTAFEALARLRAAPAVHSRGVVLDATLVLSGRGAAARPLGGQDSRPAVVRVSKSVGTPGGLPDLLGIALRVPLYGGTLLDMLFASVGRHRATGLLLAPSRGWCRRRYTTVLPYRVDGRVLLLGLDPEEPGRADSARPDAVREAVGHAPLAFAVTEGPLVGPRRTIGRLVLESARPVDGGISFDPVLNAHPDLRPVELLTGLREWAYTGSRRGRRAEPAALHRAP